MLFKSNFLRYIKLQKFGYFPIYLWQNGQDDVRRPPTWLPPYKPEEILQTVSDHNFNISKFINLKFWEDI